MQGSALPARFAYLPLLLAVASTTLPFTVSANELKAQRTQNPVTLDGEPEATWDKATPLKILLERTPYQPDNGYAGITRTEVQMRALYDDQNLYLLVQYSDPTESLARKPWLKQEDGNWTLRSQPDSTSHENTFYEDKFAVLWNINARGFEKKGCDAACHMAVNGKNNGFDDRSPGRKYLRDGETLDMWHWKSVRSNPVGQSDDQYIDHTRDPAQNKNWGRKTDHKTAGGYSDNVTNSNVTDDKRTPIHMAKQPVETFWLLADNVQPFIDTFKSGDQVPSIVISAFEGSRGDIATRGAWKDGQWTLELRRALVTQGPDATSQDVQFKDLKQSYPFGVAVFDNSQINHVYHNGSYRLIFE